VANGRVYTVGSDHAYCLDAQTGRKLWAVAISNKGLASSFLVEDGVAVLQNDALLALDAATGRQLWEVQVADTMEGYSITSPPLNVASGISMATTLLSPAGVT